jgi:hypothetical protein
MRRKYAARTASLLVSVALLGSQLGAVVAVWLVPTPVLASEPSGPPFSFLAKPGPYAVGLRVIEQYDYSRIFQPALDDLGKPYQGERARPLQTLIWYPAQRVARKAMTFGEYKKLAETETTFGAPRLLTGWFIDGTKSALRSTLWSVRDAPAESGRFPLVIYAPSFSSWAWENADLCEYLASYGYIVIASPGMGVRRTSTHDVLGTDAQSRGMPRRGR